MEIKKKTYVEDVERGIYDVKNEDKFEFKADKGLTKEIVETINEVNDNILIYGEPWKGGDSPLVNGICKGMQKGQDFSVFNDILIYIMKLSYQLGDRP